MFSPEPASDDVSASFGQPLGQVVSVRGSRARLGLLVPPIEDLEAVHATIGKFLGILTTESLLVGVITNVFIEPPACADELAAACTGTARLTRQSQAITAIYGNCIAGPHGYIIRYRAPDPGAPTPVGPSRAAGHVRFRLS